MKKYLSCAALFIAGCGSPAADLSNEEILTLLGSNDFRGGPEISNGVVECVRMIAGLDAEVYEGAGEEFKGMLETECRRSLKANLDDSERNPKGLTLDDIDDPSFAERLTEAKSELDATAEAEREKLAAEERKKRLAEYQAEKEARLEVLEETALLLEEAEPLCEKWAELKEATNRWLNSQLCGRDTFSDFQAEFEQTREELEAEPGEDVNNRYLRVPSLGVMDPEHVRRMMNRAESEIAAMEQRL